MQRFEIVDSALKEIEKTIIITPVAKHWDLDEQKKAIKASEEELKSVVEMSDLVKTLIYHEYPITVVTFVQPAHAGEMHISAADDPVAGCLSIQFSPALLGMIGDIRKKEFSAVEHQAFSTVEQIAKESVQRIFYMTVDYIDAEIREEREWMEYLCEVVG